jgi:hypothetical protein
MYDGVSLAFGCLNHFEENVHHCNGKGNLHNNLRAMSST